MVHFLYFLLLSFPFFLFFLFFLYFLFIGVLLTFKLMESQRHFSIIHMFLSCLGKIIKIFFLLFYSFSWNILFLGCFVWIYISHFRFYAVKDDIIVQEFKTYLLNQFFTKGLTVPICKSDNMHSKTVVSYDTNKLFCYIYRLVFLLLTFKLMESQRHFCIIHMLLSHLGKIIKIYFYSFILLVGISYSWLTLCESTFFISDFMQSRMTLQYKSL